MKNNFLLFLLILNIQIGFTQNQSDLLNPFLKEIKSLDFNKAKNLLIQEENTTSKELKKLLLLIIEDDRQTYLRNLSPKFEELKKVKFSNEQEQYIAHLIKGFIYLNYEKNRAKSYQNFIDAYNISKKTNDLTLQKNALYFILQFYQKGILQGNKSFKKYLELYKEKCTHKIDWFYYYSFSFNLLSQTETYNEENSKLQNELESIFITYDSVVLNNNFNEKLLSFYYKDKANLIIRKKPSIAKKYFLKAFNNYDESNYYKFQKLYGLINIARSLSLEKKYDESLYFLNKAKQFISFNDSLLDKYDINAHKSTIFNHLKQYDSAYFYEKEVRFLTYEINFQQENQKVSELKTELETEKKEKENLQLKQDNILSEQKRKQNRNLFLGSLGFLVLGGSIGLLTLKNSRKKRLLAEQKQELEKQKNLTLLKEQEINTINAMINGQEKERIRIAEDLHDNIGSVLATLKLHFENLKLNREKKHFNQDELYSKTEKLIDETYLKVRSIAHAKNAGVIANKGLLVAVKLMAEKISDANKIKIEVLDYGLDKRLDNNLEITVFRIIQELTTNIIKHANATKATINLSQFDENLNIIIEDNGKGFNIKTINLKEGIGINSIKTRIKHLKGTFEVDSTIGKGSSIIMNIPVS